METDDIKRYVFFTGAAYQVFLICFKNAGLKLQPTDKHKLQERGWGTLKSKIKSELEQNLPNSYNAQFRWENDIVQVTIKGTPCVKFNWKKYHNYLRDRFREICELLDNEGKFYEKGFEKYDFLPLLIYANIENSEAFNEKYKALGDSNEPVIIPVFFKAKPPKKFNLFDIPDDEGLIYYYGDNRFDYKSEDAALDIESFEPVNVKEYMMSNGTQTLWIKVDYNNINGKKCTAYFAEFEIGPYEAKLVPPENLLNTSLGKKTEK